MFTKSSKLATDRAICHRVYYFIIIRYVTRCTNNNLARQIKRTNELNFNFQQFYSCTSTMLITTNRKRRRALLINTDFRGGRLISMWFYETLNKAERRIFFPMVGQRICLISPYSLRNMGQRVSNVNRIICSRSLLFQTDWFINHIAKITKLHTSSILLQQVCSNA